MEIEQLAVERPDALAKVPVDAIAGVDKAKAVEILMRVKGMSEKDAVGTVVAHLRSAQRAVERGGPIAPGHRTPTAEIADLLARYPGNTPD